MKNTAIVLLISLTILTAQANIISSLLKHTHLKGKANIDTSKGLDFSYNTTLGFRNKHVSIDLANLVTKFKAQKDQNKNSVDYRGALFLTQDGNAVNATVNGTVSYTQQTNSSANESTQISETVVSTQVRNVNNWGVQAGNIMAAGVSNGTLNTTLIIDQKDNLFQLVQDTQGLNVVNGNITFDGKKNNTFTYGRMGAMLLKEDILVDPKCASHNHPSRLPNATMKGKVAFYDIEGKKFNDVSSGVIRQGGAAFMGESYFNSSNDSDSRTAKVVNAQKNMFMYKNQVFQNGEKIGDTYVRGQGGYAQAVNSVMFSNGTIDITAANYGGLDEDWVAVPANKTRRSSRLVLMDIFDLDHHHHHHDHNEEEEGSEHHHHHHHHHHHDHHHYHHDHHDHHDHHHNKEERGSVQKGVIAGAWKAGLHYRNGQTNDIGTRGVNLKTGLFYDVKGNDTVSAEPWEIKGNRTSNTYWEIAANQSQYDNIIINTDTNDNFLDEVEASNSKLRNFLGHN